MTFGKFVGALIGGVILVGSVMLTGMAGVFAFLVGLVIFGWAVIDGIWTRKLESRQIDLDVEEAHIKFGNTISMLDRDGRAYLGMEFPELEVELFDGKFAIYVKGANNLHLECLQRFLKDSDESEFASIHRYNDDKTLQTEMNMTRDSVREQWTRATEFLQRKNYIIPNSARGPYSYRWLDKECYKRMKFWYVGEKRIPNLGIEGYE